ncbi:hypothetical protein [Caulobacter phage KcrB]|nr:hypothetical protein RW_GP079c [Caulobacter phage RW]WCA46383.1 hypothetical protein [Caulobacter phage KcrB]WCD56318.1 hypothetical protein [Caulobacter phage RLK]WNV48110.1 hypothetical protein GB2A_gp078c [Caulobacter phage GB2A]
MTDLKALSNSQFAASFRDHVIEAERRLAPTGYVRAKDRMTLIHQHLNLIAKQLVKDGEVSGLSVGGDKPEGPPPDPPGTP